ncbi:MAG: DUF2520 domain-containing protein, partial [Gammaproteobacteria bacterium]|nr:DUF2520 domain-containing protein [Gammaproteobacteria bacterium]
MIKPTVALIGAGSAGTAMTVALHREGYPIAAVSSRSVESAQRCGSLVDCEHTGTDPASASRQAEIIIISTPDSAIETICQTMADSGGFCIGQLVLHLSGALTSDALNAARAAGADTLSLHPAQTMVEPLQGADLLKTAWFCLEGNDSAVARGRYITNDISGNTIVIDKDKKALYHAALSFSSNYLTTVEAIAIEMLTETGISRQNALALLMPLIQGSVDTLANCGLPDALTGPMSRGDAKTIEKHLRAMKQGPESHLQIYK